MAIRVIGGLSNRQNNQSPAWTGHSVLMSVDPARPPQLQSSSHAAPNKQPNASSSPPIPFPLALHRHRYRAHPTHSQTRRVAAHAPSLPAQTVHQPRRARFPPALPIERQRAELRIRRTAAEGRRGGEVLGWAVGCEGGCCEGLLVAEAYV